MHIVQTAVPITLQILENRVMTVPTMAADKTPVQNSISGACTDLWLACFMCFMETYGPRALKRNKRDLAPLPYIQLHWPLTINAGAVGGAGDLFAVGHEVAAGDGGTVLVGKDTRAAGEWPAFQRKKPAFQREKPAFQREKPAFLRKKPAFLRKKPAFPR